MRNRLIVAAGIAAATSVASANVLINGSFEQPEVPTGSFGAFTPGQIIGSGWIVTSADLSSAVIPNGYAGGGASWHTTPAGRQYLYVGDSVGNATVSQTFNLVGGVPCSLDFLQAAFIAPAVQGRVYIDVLQGGSSVLAGGETLFTVAAGTDFVPHSVSFTSTVTGPYTIRVRAEQGFVACVDDFVLVPAPGALGAIALGGLILRRRTR